MRASRTVGTASITETEIEIARMTVPVTVTESARVMMRMMSAVANVWLFLATAAVTTSV